VRFEVDDLIDAGDSAVVLGRFLNRGRAAVSRPSSRAAGVCRILNGLIVRTQVYFRQAEALEAVGLRE
jgi:hypothetical protein